jgi:hypothetical protein
MENRKTDPSVVSGLKLEGTHPASGDPHLVPDTRPKEDPDEIVHEQDEQPTEDEIRNSDPDELVHRVDNFNEDHSKEDPDDLVHRQSQTDDSGER